MKRCSLFFLVVGLLVGVVVGLFLDTGVSAQRVSVQGTVMYLSAGTVDLLSSSSLRGSRAVAYCFTAGSGIHCLPAR